MPAIGVERERFWIMQQDMMVRIGGVEPRELVPLRCQINLPRFIHVHMDTGLRDEIEWGMTLGVNAVDAVKIRAVGCPVSLSYLAGRGLSNTAKILMISAKDGWLQKFYSGLGVEFFESVRRADFQAVVCPNLSAYHHTEHRVWLDNRALIQRFMERLLEKGIPGIFFSYLENAPVHQRWLTEYFRLNPSQQVLATGFDRKARGAFFEQRMRLLAQIEQDLGRPLRIILNCVVSRIQEIRLASRLFPGRVHLMGQSLFHKSYRGKLLTVGERGHIQWSNGGDRFLPGPELFSHNARALEEALSIEAPDFFASNR